MGYEVYADTGYHDVCTVTQWRGELDVDVANRAFEADAVTVLALDEEVIVNTIRDDFSSLGLSRARSLHADV